jgi:tRNA pseudouridine55 synthase
VKGLLLINKPNGWTSFDVVNYVRRQAALAEDVLPKSIKVGHCGTLDPFATGLLIVLVGREYTRVAKQYTGLDKVYEVTARLGLVSTTGDSEGQIKHVNGSRPDKAVIVNVLEKLTGTILQKPPAHSAVKVNGQRAYKLARSGKSLQLLPRQVTVYGLTLKSYRYPDLQLTAHVSSGTYIRSLVYDLGKMLHSGAYTIALKRTQVGEYKLDKAHEVAQLTSENISDLLQK